MNVKLKRPDSGSIVATANGLATMVVLQDTTTHDHYAVKNILEGYFHSKPVDIYYGSKLASVFMFDTAGRPDLSRKEQGKIRNKLGNRKYAIIQNGRLLKGNSLQSLTVQCTDDGQVTVLQPHGVIFTAMGNQ